MGWQVVDVIANQVIIQGPNGALLVYSPVPAHANLSASVSGSNFTDNFGNFVDAGVAVYNESLGTAWVATSGGWGIFSGINKLVSATFQGLMLYNATTPSTLEASIASQQFTDSQSGLTIPVGFQAQAMNFMNQASNPSAGPNGPVLFSDTTGTSLEVNTTSSMLMGIGACNTDAATHTVTQTIATAIAKNWPANLGDAQNGTVYRIKVYCQGTQGSTQQSLHMGLSLNSTNLAEIAITATLIPVSTNFGLVVEFTMIIHNSTTVDIYQEGVMSIGGTNTLTSSNSLPFVGQSNGNAYNGAVGNFFTPYAFWFANVGAPTITSHGSTFERLGP